LDTFFARALREGGDERIAGVQQFEPVADANRGLARFALKRRVNELRVM
jgi:hypothetical protein